VYPPLWSRFLRLYGHRFPVLRGKSRIARWAYHSLPRLAHPLGVAIDGGIRIEVWPWLWPDFCTYILGSPELYHLSYFKSRTCMGSTVFDIGAYIGLYALTASRIVATGAVHAFESDPRSAARLAHAIERNNLRNVHLSRSAVGERSGELQFVLRDFPPTSSLQGSYSLPALPGEEGDTISVPMCTLDEYCAAESIDRICLVKIDVEGAELQVLRGAAGAIREYSPELMIEIHPMRSRAFGCSVQDTFEYLYALGYELFHIIPALTRPRLAPFLHEPGAHAERHIVIARPKE